MPKKKVSKDPETMLPFVSSSRDIPATQGMLQLVRTELKADIRSLSSEMKAGFSQIDSRFSQIDSRFSQIDSKFSQIDSNFSQLDSKFSQIDSRFNQVDSKFERVIADVARIGVLVEEQNANNRIVLEGLTGLWQSQERVEVRIDDVEKFVRSIGRSRT